MNVKYDWLAVTMNGIHKTPEDTVMNMKRKTKAILKASQSVAFGFLSHPAKWIISS